MKSWPAIGLCPACVSGIFVMTVGLNPHPSGNFVESRTERYMLSAIGVLES